MLEVVNVAPIDAVLAIQIIEGANGSSGREGGGRAGLVLVGERVAVLVSSRADVEVAIVVAADDHFLGVGELEQPVDAGLDLLDTAVITEVAGVD